MLDASEIVEQRMKQLRLSKLGLSRRLKKSPSWAGVVFFGDVERAVRHMYYKEPEAFIRLLSALDWTEREFWNNTGIDPLIPNEIGNLGYLVVGEDRALPVGYHTVQVTGAEGGKPLNYSEVVVRDTDFRPGCRAFVIQGKSMEGGPNPIYDGDTVLADTALTTLADSKIFVFEVIGDGYTVKRARLFDGEWWMVPDNQDTKYKPLKEAEVKVVGRVYKVLPASRAVK